MSFEIRKNENGKYSYYDGDKLAFPGEFYEAYGFVNGVACVSDRIHKYKFINEDGQNTVDVFYHKFFEKDNLLDLYRFLLSNKKSFSSKDEFIVVDNNVKDKYVYFLSIEGILYVSNNFEKDTEAGSHVSVDLVYFQMGSISNHVGYDADMKFKKLGYKDKVILRFVGGRFIRDVKDYTITYRQEIDSGMGVKYIVSTNKNVKFLANGDMDEVFVKFEDGYENITYVGYGIFSLINGDEWKLYDCIRSKVLCTNKDFNIGNSIVVGGIMTNKNDKRLITIRDGYNKDGAKFCITIDTDGNEIYGISDSFYKKCKNATFNDFHRDLLIMDNATGDNQSFYLITRTGEILAGPFYYFEKFGPSIVYKFKKSGVTEIGIFNCITMKTIDISKYKFKSFFLDARNEVIRLYKKPTHSGHNFDIDAKLLTNGVLLHPSQYDKIRNIKKVMSYDSYKFYLYNTILDTKLQYKMLF